MCSVELRVPWTTPFDQVKPMSGLDLRCVGIGPQSPSVISLLVSQLRRIQHTLSLERPFAVAFWISSRPMSCPTRILRFHRVAMVTLCGHLAHCALIAVCCICFDFFVCVGWSKVSASSDALLRCSLTLPSSASASQRRCDFSTQHTPRRPMHPVGPMCSSAQTILFQLPNGRFMVLTTCVLGILILINYQGPLRACTHVGTLEKTRVFWWQRSWLPAVGWRSIEHHIQEASRTHSGNTRT